MPDQPCNKQPFGRRELAPFFQSPSARRLMFGPQPRVVCPNGKWPGRIAHGREFLQKNAAGSIAMPRDYRREGTSTATVPSPGPSGAAGKSSPRAAVWSARSVCECLWRGAESMGNADWVALGAKASPVCGRRARHIAKCGGENAGGGHIYKIRGLARRPGCAEVGGVYLAGAGAAGVSTAGLAGLPNWPSVHL